MPTPQAATLCRLPELLSETGATGLAGLMLPICLAVGDQRYRKPEPLALFRTRTRHSFCALAAIALRRLKSGPEACGDWSVVLEMKFFDRLLQTAADQHTIGQIQQLMACSAGKGCRRVKRRQCVQSTFGNYVFAAEVDVNFG